MRAFTMGLVTASAVIILGLVTATPAAAYDYPWCLQDRAFGIPGDCSYQTYAQCMTSASGRYATCNVNPRVAYARMLRSRRAHSQDAGRLE
jgi:hypothetical protein